MMNIRHSNIPVSHLLIVKEKKVLLIRRFNTGYEDGNYSLIAGHVDENETFTKAIIREAKEEAGINIKSTDLKFVLLMHRNSKQEINNERADVFFMVQKWSGKLRNMEPEECDDFAWFSLDNLPENIIPYIKKAIEGVNNGVVYCEYGWAK